MPRPVPIVTLPWILGSMLLSCSPAKDTCQEADCDPDTAAVIDDSGTPPSVDCIEDEGAFVQLRDEPTLIPTVRRVRWQLSTPVDATVHFWEQGQEQLTPVVAAAEQQQTLVMDTGPLQDVSWQIWFQDGDTWHCSAPRTFTTGLPDARLPELTVSLAPDSDTRGGLAIVPLFSSTGTFVTAIDQGGRIVWAQPISVQSPRAALARGGGAILVGLGAASAESDALIFRYGLDGTVLSSTPIRGGHTDMVELPDGSLAMLGWDIRDFEGGKRHLLGDTIIERSPEGEDRIVWDTYDSYVPDLTRSYETNFYQSDHTVEDWTHANGMSYDEEEDAYYVSISNLNLIAKIDRRTGAQVWSVGEVDATIPASMGFIERPHSVEHLPDGSFLVFNRRSMDCSSADRFTVDPVRGQVALLSTYSTPDCQVVTYLGDARLQDDGGMLVSWSSSGRLQQIDAAQQTLRQVDLPLGYAFGFVDPIQSLYDTP